MFASLLLRRSSSTLFNFPASSFSSPNPSSISTSTPPDNDLWLEDGETQADLQSLLSPDLSTSLRYLLTVLSTPSATPKLALRVATFILNPPRPTPLPSSPTSSSSRTVRTKPESTRSVVALLLGITSVLSRSHSHEEDEKDLENLSECLVGIFVKGGGKSAELDEDVAVAILGGTTERGVRKGSRSTWELSRAVIERLDSRTMEMQQSDDSVEEEQVRVRTRINSTYLLALLSSPSSSSSQQPTSATTPLSSSETLFARCIELGLSISLVGASSSTTSSDDDSHSSHANSLVWKARKRLELSGHSSIAVVGLPSDGGAFQKWDGGAVERARLAEQVRRDKMVAGEEKNAFRSDVWMGRLGDGSSVLRSEGGDLLDAPRRLKGKKIVAQRRGFFTRSSVSSSRSSSGPPTPTDEVTTLRFTECPFPHHSHVPTATTSSSPSPSQPTTSLPSLNAKPSIHLLRIRLTASPPRSSSCLPRDHRTDPPFPSPENLKSPTPIPLPNLLNQNGIFSPAQASIEPLSPIAEDVETESIFERGSGLLRRSVSRLALSFARNEPTPPPPVPTPSSISSTSSPPPPPPSPSSSTARGRPSSIRISSFGQSSVSSGSSTSSSPTSPIHIFEVPKIAFQPSSFRYDCFDGNGSNQPSSGSGSIWRPSSSPRGDRVRVLGGPKRGRREN